MSDPITYLCIRTGTLSYAILKDADATEAYFLVTGNSSTGYYSRVAVPFTGIEAALAHLAEDQAFPAKTLKPAFPSGKSANDPGFLLALLRHEGLLTSAPEGAHLSVRSGDWAAWKDAVLAEAGEPFELPTKQIKTIMTTTDSITSSSITATPPVVIHKGKKGRKARTGHAHPHRGSNFGGYTPLRRELDNGR
ncbi:hypothetical protein [Zoogloea sp.]|uniref:hypothetical protein n=1 Tax=Zoogloea sp. TaxID=49181 RepID=UPI0026268E18|nr:hypothetical protein [Zoogloea sp.]MDD3355210.1 hypothetical protein [Zoogloea sp.]